MARARSGYQRPSGRLIGLLQGDLPDYTRESRPDGRVSFAVPGAGITLDVSMRLEKRFLGRTEIAVFEAALGGSTGGTAHMEIRHQGRMRRSGLSVKVKQGDQPAEELARAIEGDVRLVEAALPLDFTRFDLRAEGASWLARVELMGASHVAMAFPPMKSYVHLHPDQREALVATLSELGRVVAGSGTGDS